MPAAVDYDLSSEDEEDDGIWCYCKTVKGGAMTGSKNINCDTKRFHMKCLKKMMESGVIVKL